MRKLAPPVFNTLLKMASVKKKRVSKKNKKSWRKNVDVQDVDNFLEDQRLEERLGIKYSEQKDEELFEIDTQGKNESCPPENVVPIYKQNVKTIARTMRLRETETPKCFQILEKRSAVPPHIINKTRVKKDNSKSRVARTIIKRKLEKEVLKAKNKVEAKASEKKSAQSKRGEFTYDVWSKENNDRDLNGCSEWLSNDAVRHTLHNTGKVRRTMPKTLLQKTSLIPAVEAPHPGLSYNPSLKDHRDILEKVVESEMKVINEEKHLNRVTTKMFNKMSRENVEKQWLTEMTVGLSMTKTESDNDDDHEDYSSINPPVRNKKKTLKKRRKLKEAVLLKEKLKQQKTEKKKISDIYKLRKIKEVLDKKEKRTLENIEKRKKLKEEKPFTTKMLSQTKYQEPEIDFSLAEELSGNLRGLKQEGNILYDRFKSLQKRNILQPTLKRNVKKRKMKKYERAHTKMGWEPKGYVPYEGENSLKK